MPNHACPNACPSDYTSPVKYIGMYIAAASLGCLLLMVHDLIFLGIRTKKRWLPCKYFSLNSVTLTLLSVAAKLTVDLTTPMPSRWDQLSKLTGIAFICIGMGILVPSVGANAESECFLNMMALTIFVITVAVNICIQLSTGVIFMFFVEHIIILSLMFLLLLMLWHISLEIKVEKRIDSSQRSALIMRGDNSLMERLRLCSFQAYSTNPQFKVSVYPMNIAVASLCVACTAVVAEAAVRSLFLNKLEFCDGNSDYSWPMRYIFVIQIVTIILGTILIVLRCAAMFKFMDLSTLHVPFLPDKVYVKQMNRTLRTKGITLQRSLNFFGSMITKIVLIAQVFTVFPWFLMRRLLRAKEDNSYGERLINDYGLEKSTDEIRKLADRVSTSESLESFCRRNPSRLKSSYNTSSMIFRSGNGQIQVSTLSMALLVKVAEACIPSSHLTDLPSAFQEVKEVIDYIDKAIISNSGPILSIGSDSTEWPSVDRVTIEKSIYTNHLWIGGDLTCLVPGYVQPSEDYCIARETLRKLKATLTCGVVWDELRTLLNFIDLEDCSSLGELGCFMEELFAAKLHSFLAQLPKAIFHNLTKHQDEEFEDSVRVAIKILFKIRSFCVQHNWEFPANMPCITNTEN